MSIEFKKERSHSAKWYRKYPRARINNLGGDRKAVIAAGWYKFNWNDDRFNRFDSRHIERFLKANIGRPVNLVFSEFLEKCDNKLRKNYPLKKVFYSFLKEKEDIDWYGGFYISNGILNYKKRGNNINTSANLLRIWEHYGAYTKYNADNMPSTKKVLRVCEKVSETKTPQLLGKFYVGRNYELENVYITCSDVPDNFLYSQCEIMGIGACIGLPFSYSSFIYGGKDCEFEYKFVVKNKKNKM